MKERERQLRLLERDKPERGDIFKCKGKISFLVLAIDYKYPTIIGWSVYPNNLVEDVSQRSLFPLKSDETKGEASSVWSGVQIAFPDHLRYRIGKLPKERLALVIKKLRPPKEYRKP